MNTREFIDKWKRTTLGERQAYQQHFCDLCDLLDHPKPAASDPTGETFCFEKRVARTHGGKGFADVWKQDFFGWEYKGDHADLNKAYKQLLDYREDLENPPLLIVSDMKRFVIHTNFTRTRPVVHEIELEELRNERSLQLLYNCLHHPDLLKPGLISEEITLDAAEALAEIAKSIRDRGIEPERTAHFLDRLVFCMFAEDIDLLPRHVFTDLAKKGRFEPERFERQVRGLFSSMARGEDYGPLEIKRFNGSLFDDEATVPLTEEEIGAIYRVSQLDWSRIDPSIFGTLFERGMDPSKRSQLGAHYTSREDIETLVEPVVMTPLRRDWTEVRETAENILGTGYANRRPTGEEKEPTKKTLDERRAKVAVLVREFVTRLTEVKVLDPACGSGNFLYVTLQKLKDLELEAITFLESNGIGGHSMRVWPGQLYGIEINPYAFDLAQMTVWIGHLQWHRAHGFTIPDNPVLRPMEGNFRRMDAIVDLTDPDNPKEPEWPEVDFIVGNPPFLGDKLMRGELGDEYVDKLRSLYQGRIPGQSDLCCYWFEKARQKLMVKEVSRVGLLATQGIRGGANREVLKGIKDCGDIFFAKSDRPWILNGANVHVSMVGFDLGQEQSKHLDGHAVCCIHSNLSSLADVTSANILNSNKGLAFIGDQKGGSFDIPEKTAAVFLFAPNPHGLPNSDVVLPWINAKDVTDAHRRYWIIDFGTNASLEYAAFFEDPFTYVENVIKPKKIGIVRDSADNTWWRHQRPRPALRRKLQGLHRQLATPRHSKFRVFKWIPDVILCDSALVVFPRSDDYFFGVVQSVIHEVWTRAQGTQVREAESGFRYTPTTCFETFPLPFPPGAEPFEDPVVQNISAAAKELDELRERWLNPPEWTTEQVLEFPGSVDGPWSRFLYDPDERGIGTVRWPRIVPKDEECAGKLKDRTLTKLYNARPTWLMNAHKELDEAVFAAYGWDAGMPDEEILEKLLELNLKQS